MLSSRTCDSYTNGCSDSTGLCVHPGQWSFPSHAALTAGPIRPHQVGLCWGLGLTNPMGSGAVTYIQHAGGGGLFSACWVFSKRFAHNLSGPSIAISCRSQRDTLRTLCATRQRWGSRLVQLYGPWEVVDLSCVVALVHGYMGLLGEGGDLGPAQQRPTPKGTLGYCMCAESAERKLPHQYLSVTKNEKRRHQWTGLRQVTR